MKLEKKKGPAAELTPAEMDQRLAGFDLYTKLHTQGDEQKRPGPMATLMCYPIIMVNPFYVTAVTGYIAYQRIRNDRTKGRIGYLSDLACVVASVTVAFLPIYFLWAEYQAQQDYQRALQSIDNFRDHYERMNDPDSRSYDI